MEIADRVASIAIAFLKHLFNRRTMPWFGEHFVSPREFSATTPEKIMAGFSAAPAAPESLLEIFGSA